MNPHLPDVPEHLVEALGRVPEEAVELFQGLSFFSGPDLSTAIIAWMVAGTDPESDPGDLSEERNARTADLLHTLARQGLIARAPEAGRERWVLDHEQRDFSRRLLAAKITADRAEMDRWGDATGSDRSAYGQEKRDPHAQTMEEIFGPEAVVQMARELHDLLRGSGDHHHEAVATNNLGHVLCDFGRYSEAVGLLGTAERLYAESGDPVWSARAGEKLEEARRLAGS